MKVHKCLPHTIDDTRQKVAGTTVDQVLASLHIQQYYLDSQQDASESVSWVLEPYPKLIRCAGAWKKSLSIRSLFWLWLLRRSHAMKKTQPMVRTFEMCTAFECMQFLSLPQISDSLLCNHGSMWERGENPTFTVLAMEIIRIQFFQF